MNNKVKFLEIMLILLILSIGLVSGCSEGEKDYKGEGVTTINKVTLDKECQPKVHPSCSIVYNPHIFDTNSNSDTNDIRSSTDCSIVFEAIYPDLPGESPREKCQNLLCGSKNKGSISIVAGDKTPCHGFIDKIDCNSCCLLSDKPIKKEQLPCTVQ